MNWTEQEKAIAKGLCDPETFAFLTKLFTLPNYDISETEVSKNIVALDDADYGRMMKVAYMVKVDNRNRLNALKAIAQNKVAKPVPIAPR